MNRMQKGTAVGAACVTLVAGFEGLRQNAYPDPATKGPPWTICYGETRGVHPGDHKTVEQCKALLIESLGEFAAGIQQCVKVPLPDGRLIALTSFAYNIGLRGACKSSVVRLINAGQTRAGCDYLLKYNRAAGIVFPGLTRRRQAERAYCVKGL